MEWINIKDKKPNNGERILATDGIKAKEGSWNSKYEYLEHCNCCYHINKNITFWMSTKNYPKETSD